MGTIVTNLRFKVRLTANRVRTDRGQTGLPANFRQRAPEIHVRLVSPPTSTAMGASTLCLHSGFGHCHTAPALSHFSTMYGLPHSEHFSGTGLPQATKVQSG